MTNILFYLGFLSLTVKSGVHCALRFAQPAKNHCIFSFFLIPSLTILPSRNIFKQAGNSQRAVSD